MKNVVGEVVLYRLSGQDSARIMSAREDRQRAAAATATFAPHQGNYANAGEVFPMVIVRQWSESLVNGQVLLDGIDTLWVTSVQEGNETGQWLRREEGEDS